MHGWAFRPGKLRMFPLPRRERERPFWLKAMSGSKCCWAHSAPTLFSFSSSCLLLSPEHSGACIPLSCDSAERLLHTKGDILALFPPKARESEISEYGSGRHPFPRRAENIVYSYRLREANSPANSPSSGGTAHQPSARMTQASTRHNE